MPRKKENGGWEKEREKGGPGLGIEWILLRSIELFHKGTFSIHKKSSCARKGGEVVQQKRVNPCSLLPAAVTVQDTVMKAAQSHIYFIRNSSVVLFLSKSLTVTGPCLKKLQNFSLGGEKEALIRLNGTNEWSYFLGPNNSIHFQTKYTQKHLFPLARLEFYSSVALPSIGSTDFESQQAADSALEPRWLAFARVDAPYGPVW